MTDQVKARAEALLPKFKLERILNQGESTVSIHHLIRPPTGVRLETHSIL